MDEILNLIESVSEGFPSYFCIVELLCCVIIELMVSAASDETAHCDESPHLRL